MTEKLISIVLAISVFMCGSISSVVYAGDEGLIPAVGSGFYYKMGGGDDVPLPAFYNVSYIPLSANGSVGFGFDCGVFNPVTSITNSLNEIKNSAMNVEQEVLSAATGAVTEFPLYELSRADPNLYNLITNAMSGAQEDMAISTKSCEVMQSEIGAGENPYANWGQISLGNRWQQDIGTAELSGNGDINEARQDVSQDAGKTGVPWVNTGGSFELGAGPTPHAGGVGQPVIHVIHDTAMAGYNVIVNDTQSSFKSSGFLGDTQSEIQKVFPTSTAAADWITNVVGDETITTYNGGQKTSQPGAGLYSDIEYETQQVLPKLQALVTNETPVSDKSALSALGSSGTAISPQVIESIQRQPRVIQAIIVDKLAQNIAASMVFNKARLAMQILQSGSRVPAIYSNKAAQKNIKTAITQLQQDMQNILMFIKAKQTLMSNMLSTVIQAGDATEQKNTEIAMPSSNAPIIQNGAVKNSV
ncbi:MAG: integrating conjugative element protein [Gammaproteobacteria bacterium CG_4_10_14_0_8_um_filter_38_16]|nr:MAG: integrating conjugative element protein [Gammaproteobacteria bacterium CG_4_10_14_0_8_um_filter_38_16]PJA04220.1 MAG: integrating conjugative element protein [Gammaproteobacteria bacterium CG_4_10_14_0_2_um_filter_38_22]PJB11055.1 MAG: integrating conjugative element protein [Gammaproteobacteria bacterium CG_4_9_14_3_um_filter_38_9]